jgi:hypothetical protein
MIAQLVYVPVEIKMFTFQIDFRKDHFQQSISLPNSNEVRLFTDSVRDNVLFTVQ